MATFLDHSFKTIKLKNIQSFVSCSKLCQRENIKNFFCCYNRDIVNKLLQKKTKKSLIK